MSIIELLSKNNTFTTLPKVIILKIKEFISNEYLTKEEKELFIKKDYSDFIKFNLKKLREETNKFINNITFSDINIESIYYLNNIIKIDYNFNISYAYTDEEEDKIFGEDINKDLDYLLDNYYDNMYLELKVNIKHKKDEKKYLKDIINKNKFLKNIIKDIKQKYIKIIDNKFFPDWPNQYERYEIKEDEEDNDYYIVYFELDLLLKYIKNRELIMNIFKNSKELNNKLKKKSNNENNNIVKNYIREIYKDILCVMVKLD